MTTRPRAKRSATGNDDGFALLTVLGSMVVITMFLLSTLAYALNNTQPSRNDQDAKAAVAAAQAGVDEYISRLNANDTYFDNGGVDASNPAFDNDGDGFGVAIPGTAGQAASFRYTPLTSVADIGRFGIIRLQVTGTSRSTSRDLVAEISPDGFLKYIYYTDLESADPRMWRTGGPANTGVPARRGTSTLTDDALGSITGTPLRPYSKVPGNTYPATPSSIEYWIVTWVAEPTRYDELCSKYWHAGRNAPTYTSGPGYEYRQGYDKFNVKKFGLVGPTTFDATPSVPVSFKCTEVRFTTGDEINGPLHSNDSLQITGPVIYKDERTTSAWDVTSPTNTATPHPSGLWWGTSAPSTSGYEPVYGVRVPLPASNTELIARAQPQTPDDPTRGCLYTGDTRITFVGNQMKVLSPLTTSSVPRCYNTTSPGIEQTVAIPPVVYVQDATSGTCTVGTVGYPKTGEWWSGNLLTTQYDCRKGNAFVSGSLSGRVTVATSNDIVIVGKTTYAGGLDGTDALGLIPNEYAWVYHPVRTDSTNLLSDAETVREIDAAILSVRRSFLAQNYFRGALLSTNNNVDDGTKLKVRGAIAQKHRGPVGTPGGGGFPAAGYVKLYLYDERLKNSPPPFFLRPDDAPWRVTRMSD